MTNLTDLDHAVQEIILNWDKKLAKSDFTKINLLMLEQIHIDYFNSPTSVKYLVNAKKGAEGEIYLMPFDPKMLETIYQAILAAKVNWSVSLRSDVICLKLPIITTQKKHLIIREWKQKCEHSRVAIRNLRHKFLQHLKNDQKLDKERWQTEQKKVQKIIDAANQKIDTILKNKIDELMKV